MNNYKNSFYDNRIQSLESAKVIVPLVIDLINPKSVIDFGCGNGSFLSIFKENKIDDIIGIDGSWINNNQLLKKGVVRNDRIIY